MIIAHRMIDEDGNVQVQSLREHSRNVARLCCAACMAVNLGHVGYLIGLLHDMGKAAEPVQRRLSGSPEKYPHAYAGARYLVERLEAMEKAGPINPYMYLLVELAATAILWHHSGRKDMVDPFGKEIWQNGLRRGQDDAVYEQGLHSFLRIAVRRRSYRSISYLQLKKLRVCLRRSMKLLVRKEELLCVVTFSSGCFSGFYSAFWWMQIGRIRRHL